MDFNRSPNHDSRPEGTTVDMLVLHYTGMQSGADAFERMCDATAKVSAHYMIEEDGTVRVLVPENRRAWHAGESFWRGNTDINARSVGIELVNPGHEFGLVPFTAAQMAALEKLSKQVVKRFSISPHNVVGHSDIAPRRKSDPGELFDWQGMADAGICLWPYGAEPVDPDSIDSAALLAEIGYETVALEKTITAFQRRFRTAKIDGIVDSETAGLMIRLSDRVINALEKITKIL
ncbi:MAG: N-acetylmuramoyl-L-alanine amidase [Alphaproteobacteria bacterium]